MDEGGPSKRVRTVHGLTYARGIRRWLEKTQGEGQVDKSVTSLKKVTVIGNIVSKARGGK